MFIFQNPEYSLRKIIIFFKIIVPKKLSGMGAPPVVESMRARKPGLQAPSNPAGSEIKKTHIFFPCQFFLRDMISNIWMSTRHISFLNSEGKAIKLTNLKLNKTYAGSKQP